MNHNVTKLFRKLLAVLIFLFGFSFVNLAITIRHDRADSRYLKLGEQFTAVCGLGRAGDGTLIAPNWILTAAHVANGLQKRGQLKANCGNTEYEVEQVFTHPAWVEMGPHDIALLKLKTAVVGIKPMAIYPDSDELTRLATIAGHGDTRTGNGGKWISDGKLRAATSKIDRIDEKWIFLNFDEPPTATDLEGAPGRGDSGGPAILFVRKKPYLAGISSLGRDGKNGPATYGAEDSFVRVSSYKTWISNVLNAKEQPAPPAKNNSLINQTKLPDSPQGKIISAYLEAFNSGDAEKMKLFFSSNLSSESLRRRAIEERLEVYRQMFNNLGGIELKEVVAVAPKSISILTKRSKGEWQKFEFEFTLQPPIKLDGVSNQTAEPKS